MFFKCSKFQHSNNMLNIVPYKVSNNTENIYDNVGKCLETSHIMYHNNPTVK